MRLVILAEIYFAIRISLTINCYRSILHTCPCISGSVPGPIIFGAFIDQTCTQWQEKCGVRASCWIYDTFKMSLYLYLAAIGFKLVSLCLFFFAYYFYKPPPKQLENGDANAPMAETVTKM